MKRFIFFAVLITNYYAELVQEDHADEMQKAWKKCKKNMTEESYEKMTIKPGIPETRDEKCFKYCFATEMGLMNGNEVNETAVKEANRKKWSDANALEIVNNITTECVNEVRTKDDACETAAAFCICMMNKVTNSTVSMPEMEVENSTSTE